MKKIIRGILLLLLTACSIRQVASPLATPTATTIIFVSQTGSGTGCTSVAPCSMPQAITMMTPGTIVEVLGVITSPYDIAKSGTPEQPITLRGGVFDGAAITNTTGQGMLTIRGNNWILDGIEIKNAYRYALKVRGNNVWLMNSNIHNNVRRYASANGCNITVSGGWESAVTFFEGTTGGGVENTRIHHNCGEGVISLGSASIRNSEIAENFSIGVYFDGANGGGAYDNRIQCADPGYFRSGQPARGVSYGVEGYTGTNFVKGNIIGNVILGCRGISLYSQVSGGQVVDSVISGNDFSQVVPPVFYAIASSNLVIENNILPGAVVPTKTPTPLTVTSPISTMTRTPTITHTATLIPSQTPTPTKTSTPSRTPTKTYTPTATLTRTSTPTKTPTSFVIITDTVPPSPTRTPTATSSPTFTPVCYPVYVGGKLIGNFCP